MSRYLLIVLMVLMAGCEAARHHDMEAHRPDEPPNGPRAEQNQPIRPMSRQNRMMRVDELTMVERVLTREAEHFRDCSQELMKARDKGYLSNEQYGDLMEKLMGDSRKIIMEVISEGRPRRPMPPPEPSPGPEQKRREKKDD